MQAQKISLEAPSNKVCKVVKQAFGNRGGIKWLPIVKRKASKAGVLELNLYPGHYRMSYRSDGRVEYFEFKVE